MREILNIEATLINDEPDEGYQLADFISLSINGFEFYRFRTSDGYMIEYKGRMTIAEAVADHLREKLSDS